MIAKFIIIPETLTDRRCSLADDSEIKTESIRKSREGTLLKDAFPLNLYAEIDM